MKSVEVNRPFGEQGAFLERAVSKQKKAVEATKTLPPLTPQSELDRPNRQALRSATRYARYLLGIDPASRR